MNRRLQQFLELEQLSPAKLADILGIQRSGISHILSGRNKPGYDFIYKFLLKFPNVNADWLLAGKGKPYKEASSPDAHNSIPLEYHIEKSENEKNTQLFDGTYPPENIKNEAVLTNVSNDKSVKRITIFYSDGSYEEFFSHK